MLTLGSFQTIEFGNRRIIGKLIHLNIARLEITYSVSILSQFMSWPVSELISI